MRIRTLRGILYSYGMTGKKRMFSKCVKSKYFLIVKVIKNGYFLMKFMSVIIKMTNAEIPSFHLVLKY